MIGDLAACAALAVYCLGAVALTLYGLNCYVMMVLFSRGRRRQQTLDRELIDRFRRTTTDDDLPVVTTQLPIFNEKYVVERVLTAVCAFDYPEGKHEIQVLDDSTDETRAITAAAVKRLRAQGHDIHHIHRKNRKGYKAGALAKGMKEARGEYLAVFDADFVPLPDFLRKTVPFLMEDPRCAFVQYLSVFKFLVGPILLLQSVGFFYVGLLSIRHNARRARSPR